MLGRARLFADHGIVRVEHLPESLLAGPAALPAAAPPPMVAFGRLDDDELRRRVAAFRGTRRELAAQLGLSERTLYRRLKALGLA